MIRAPPKENLPMIEAQPLPMIEAQPTIVSLTDAAAVKLAELTVG